MVEALPRPRLRDEDGRELFDLPDAPRPDEDVPAPVRFLYDFDNLLLSQVDGVTAGDWVLRRTKEPATLELRPFHRLSSVDTVERETAALVAFLAPDVPEHEVRTTLPAASRP